MVLQAVIDDSGKGGRDVFVLAGFVLSADQWIAFSDQWDSILQEPPSIKYFKAKEASHTYMSGQFLGFGKEARDRKVQKLVSLILSYEPLVIRHVISISAYEKHFKGKIAKQMDYPYLLAYYSVMGTMAIYQRTHRWNDSSTVDFVFDEQGKESLAPQMVWQFAKDNVSDELKPLLGNRPIHQDEKCFAPLQAADLVAWHGHRFYFERLRNKVYEHPVWLALNGLRCAESETSESSLKKMLAGIKNTGGVFEYDLPPELRKIFLRRWKQEKFGIRPVR